MEICDGVFLGDLRDLERSDCTSVLSLYNLPLDLSRFGEKKLVYKVEDSPVTDLLTEFPRMIDFIKRQIKENEAEDGEENSVLVHCQAGSSRSVTAVIAFLIGEGIVSTVEEGIALIVQKGGSPNPNEGFLAQLELWQEMGGKLDTNNPGFKQYRMSMFQESMMLGAPHEDRPGNFEELVKRTPSERDPAAFKCKKCRRALFLPAAIIPHGDGYAGKKDFLDKKRRRMKDREQKNICSSVFLEPMEWMEDLIRGKLNGLLTCPKCSQKVGHFDWSGSQCSCGQWVSPAIQVHRKQTDAPPGFGL